MAMRIEKQAAVEGEEQPLALLFACHERIRRFSQLAERLANHVQRKGADAEAQQAASNVLRYFEQALPNHHADEELDVFPALRALNDASMNQAIDRLLLQHESLDVLWTEVQPWLLSIAAGHVVTVPAVLPSWVADYAAHTADEERHVFPAIKYLPPAIVTQIALSMRLRRGDKA